MDTKDVQVVATGEGSQRKTPPQDQGRDSSFAATGQDVVPTASRKRHSRRQVLEKGMEDERYRAQVVSMEAFKAGRVGQVPPELLQMYDQVTRDQHALARTTTVMLTSVRRALGLPDI
ncbi:hypothetical protein D3C71_1588010 [compost metagenome]